jgi:hypothetical protein
MMTKSTLNDLFEECFYIGFMVGAVGGQARRDFVVTLRYLT